ncbi:uncharacterized protein LOC143340867 [Colletes latitarsis]|uniref:uncharacterized protein LOC143340867 n=1 Tax=Colletes latitarsis TaxID=2605962 RepID=UPI00403562CB
MLHRSTSSRRCRGATAVAGPRGRRASVATDRPVDMPQTSPRSTMERQRSPRGSFVPDIALDPETDSSDEVMDHRMPPERDQYGGSRSMINQRMSRSPRNSLVPDDYYRYPRNGRNLVAPDMQMHGSRHSLVPEVTMSPRNSLVPDMPYDRSPRNSLVPLTGSRTSLMSENGKPMVSRSPRPSLIPNSSRSPHGSITNMELIDRSPQRSPRCSIASECLNQSPRNSIAPYEQQPGRSSRGSIGVNDVPRGSIGANEEEMRSPRRTIDPDIIDRTPRGSLGGLPETRTMKASLMAQDPRRASADQGLSGSRNSSPYRTNEVNSGSVKSGGSTIQINLEYGQNVVEDSRRASSSVSQFSGDESRRLFNSVAKVPQNTLENGNLGVITYGSVVFQLKDANLEANSTCDFVFRALKVVFKTRVVTVSLVCLFAFPLLMLIFGWKYSNDCPKEENLPIYMIIGGACGMILMVLMIYSQIRSRRAKVMSVISQRPKVTLSKVIIVILSLFLMCWFVAGNYWILSILWPSFSRPTYSPDDYCNELLYKFSLFHLVVIYTIVAITLLVMIVLASFRILACPLPQRYK